MRFPNATIIRVRDYSGSVLYVEVGIDKGSRNTAYPEAYITSSTYGFQSGYLCGDAFRVCLVKRGT